MTCQPPQLATDLRQAIRPLFRRLLSDRVLPMGEFSVLNRLYIDGPLSGADLARAEHVSPQAMTGVVRDLEGRSLIRRSQDPHDGRRQLIELSSEGRSVIESERNSGQGWLSRAIEEKLDPSQRAELSRLIELLGRLVE